mmetsp:Transcript_37339/g.93263  ORF Transcript_37339/g.93263 Transcript_37339/m.93263 type:complete len:261 (-) Transcript_37339:567-1349(-)
MLVTLAAFSLALQLPHVPVCTNGACRGATVAMKVPATIGDAKQNFQAVYGKWNIPSQPAQSFINNMLTQQYAMVAPTYRYSRIFSVGFESLCTAFLASTTRDTVDAEAVRKALYSALDMDAAKCKADADALLELAAGKSEAELLASDDFAQIKASPFKYSLPFGMGIIALMKAVGVEPKESIGRWCEALELPNTNSLTRDFEYFELQITKLETFKEMVLQMSAAGKRNEAARLKAKAEKAAKEAEKAEEEAAKEEASASA